MRILHHGRDQLLDPTAYKGVATMPPEAGSASCLGQYQSSQMELIEAEPGSRAEPDAPEPGRRTRAGQGMGLENDSLGCTTWQRPPLTDPARGGHEEPAGRDGRMAPPGAKQKDKKERCCC